MKPGNLSLQLLSQHLQERLKSALPGPTAHEVMRAKFNGKLKPRFEHTDPPRVGGVLILLFEQHNTICFPLIKRPVYAGVHSGQISLPGGKAEPGENLLDTALREGEEEIGISRKEVNVLGRLSNFHVLPSNFLITPVVGIVHSTPVFVPDSYEVARILHGRIDELLKPDAIKEKEIMVESGLALTAPHFEIDGEVVWGATAMILSELRHIIQEIVEHNIQNN